MGFMGLDSWVESDCAADFRSELVDTLYKQTIDELENKANQYNTPGYINVALLLEDGAYDILDSYELDDEKWIAVFDTVVEGIEHSAKNWNEPALLRLRRSVKDFVSERQ